LRGRDGHHGRGDDRRNGKEGLHCAVCISHLEFLP
jgi:hypothetical protein